MKIRKAGRTTVLFFVILVNNMAERRADRIGAHRVQFEKNRKKIIASQDVCGICGKPVDKTLRPPHPLSPTVDHIIPVSRGGHPSDISNLQLAHRCCNREKSNKMIKPVEADPAHTISNRDLPQTFDWKTYKANGATVG